ncbi:MAG: GAF domain-containing sensor histidine kinase [Dehalococcoidia bacterium]
MKASQRYRILYGISQKLNSNVAPDEVLNTIVETICEVAAAKGASLLLLTPDKQQLIHIIDYGLSENYVKKGPLKIDAGSKLPLQGTPVQIPDITSDPRSQYREESIKEGVVSILSLPLMCRGEVIGIARIYTAEKRKFSLQEIDFYGALANLGAIALERARLFESTDRDLATCIVDRSNLEEEKRKFLEFISIAAHDLKAPLSAIQSFLAVMISGYVGELNEKQKHMMERSSQRINELLQLISDLLDIPRIEMGQLVSEMEKLSMHEVVQSFAEEGQSLAGQKDVAFSINVPSDLPAISGSLPRLKQVITNLFNNALCNTDNGVITINAFEKGNDIVVEVLDTGCGIPADELPKIFEDFFRTSNTESKGTGLGLSISKRIISAHGGYIWVESPCAETGSGSKFCFSLPRAK